MNITIDLSRLEAALRSIGGTPARLGKLRRSAKAKGPSFNFAPGAIGPTEIILEPKDLKRLRNTSGLLAVDGKQVTLHIFQPTFVDTETLLSSPLEGPRVHFTECKTIEKMRADGKFNRYVTATRKDGLFSMEPYGSLDGERIEAPLLPCKNCLSSLNYAGWLTLDDSSKQHLLNNFSFKKLHEDFRFIFRCLPRYTADTFPDGNYPND